MSQGIDYVPAQDPAFVLEERGECDLTIAEKLDEILTLLRAERASVKVTLKRSSTKDGGEGWDIEVRSDWTHGDILSAINGSLDARSLLQEAMFGIRDERAPKDEVRQDA